jgi:hypothetical protein
MATVLLTTGALASPSLAEHHHGEAGDAHPHVDALASSEEGHTHVDTDVDPDANTDVASATTEADGHTHDTTGSTSGSTETTVHDHGTATASGTTTNTTVHDHATTPGSTTDTTAHDHGPTTDASAPPASGAHHHAECTAPVTAAQQAAADRLAADTKAQLARFANLADAEALGYKTLTPNAVGIVHYGNRAYMLDGNVLDTAKPESLIYGFGKDGTPYLLGAMFMANPGEPGPAVGGCATIWHDHQNLCLANQGGGVVGIVDDQGSCPAGSTNRGTGEMLHVWDIPVPGGPFSEPTPVEIRNASIAKFTKS